MYVVVYICTWIYIHMREIQLYTKEMRSKYLAYIHQVASVYNISKGKFNITTYVYESTCVN